MPTKYSAAKNSRTRLKDAVRPIAFTIAFALASALSGPSIAQDQGRNWVGTWMANPQPIWGSDFPFPTKIPASANDQTFLQVVQISLGGARMRLVFSNTYGDKPVRIGGASVGLASDNGAAVPGTIQQITFGGRDGIIIPHGAPAISDQVEMAQLWTRIRAGLTFLPQGLRRTG